MSTLTQREIYHKYHNHYSIILFSVPLNPFFKKCEIINFYAQRWQLDNIVGQKVTRTMFHPKQTPISCIIQLQQYGSFLLLFFPTAESTNEIANIRFYISIFTFNYLFFFFFKSDHSFHRLPWIFDSHSIDIRDHICALVYQFRSCVLSYICENRVGSNVTSVNPSAGCGNIHFRVQMNQSFFWVKHAAERHKIYVERIIKFNLYSNSDGLLINCMHIYSFFLWQSLKKYATKIFLNTNMKKNL